MLPSDYEMKFGEEENVNLFLSTFAEKSMNNKIFLMNMKKYLLLVFVLLGIISTADIESWL